MGFTIAVASGKGGTGKTTVATSLSAVLAKTGRDVAYVDCDVEEPNGHLFLRPQLRHTIEVKLPFPKVNFAACTFCAECAQLCEFRALAVVKDSVLVFNELCHNCGVCYHLCPENAIYEVPEGVGRVILGRSNGLKFAGGELNVGVARAPAIIEATKKQAPEAEYVIMDAPPGTSCAAVEAVKGADFVLLVTEPTPFGLNDLNLAVEMLQALNISCAAVLNRSDVGDNGVEEYCRAHGIDILMRIPENREIAEAYSSGVMLLAERAEYAENLIELFKKIENRVNHAEFGRS
jgi:MinD superfamily P-loop ATPase